MFIADPGSEFSLSQIPDPGSKRSRIRICIRIKEFNYCNPKEWFLSSRKYDLGCSSRFRIPDSDLVYLPIPDPDPQHCTQLTAGSAKTTRICNTVFKYRWLNGRFDWITFSVVQCCGSVTFCYGSGSAYPYLWLTDSDPTPILVSDRWQQKKIPKFFCLLPYYLQLHLHHLLKIKTKK